MPRINIEPAQLEAEILQIINELKQEFSWTRKRLIKLPNGNWIRVGRLRRVKYID